MNKEKIKEILYILMAIILGILTVKFVIWAFPIVLIAIISYYIYQKMKKIRQNKDNGKPQNNKTKDIKIIDMEDDK